MSRLKETYKNDVAPALMKKFSYKSVMQIPKLEKVVINVGAGEARDNAKVIDAIVSDLSQITGQRPVVCKAKKSVANFKLREGMNIGAKVTLRGEKMYEFVDRLFSVALPRVRDFRGINANSFDGRGNYSMGLKEQLIFPEIEFDKIDKVRGMDICFVTTANTDEEARELLTLHRRSVCEIRRESAMAKTSMKVKSEKDSLNILPADTTDARSAVAPMPIFANSAFAVSASVNSLTKAKFPALKRQAGNHFILQLGKGGITVCKSSDTIADMLTRIRNASSAKHESVDVPASNMKKAIAQILVGRRIC